MTGRCQASHGTVRGEGTCWVPRSPGNGADEPWDPRHRLRAEPCARPDIIGLNDRLPWAGQRSSPPYTVRRSVAPRRSSDVCTQAHRLRCRRVRRPLRREARAPSFPGSPPRPAMWAKWATQDQQRHECAHARTSHRRRNRRVQPVDHRVHWLARRLSASRQAPTNCQRPMAVSPTGLGARARLAQAPLCCVTAIRVHRVRVRAPGLQQPWWRKTPA